MKLLRSYAADAYAQAALLCGVQIYDTVNFKRDEGDMYPKLQEIEVIERRKSSGYLMHATSDFRCSRRSAECLGAIQPIRELRHS